MSFTYSKRSVLRRISHARHYMDPSNPTWRLLGHTRDYVLISLGVFSAGLGLEGFLVPNRFTDGGITGISILVSIVTDVPLYIYLVVFNLPFLVMGYRQISTAFALKTIYGILALAFCTAFVPYPILTEDKLLIAVFGGFFLGAGIGLSMRGGGVIDGTEVLALNISKKTVLTVGDVILAINIVIFSFAILVIGFERSLYSILTYLAAAKTVDFIVQGIEEYTGVTVISSRAENIRLAIVNDLGRGVTIYKGERGYGRTPISDNKKDNKLDIIFCVVTRLEVPKLRQLIQDHDPQAFIIIQSINEIRGGMVKKRPLH